MSQRLRSAVLLLAIATTLFAACSKKFSSDSALPTAHYPSVIINSDNNVVYAINPSNGKRNWQYSLPNDIGTTGAQFRPSPLIYNNFVYLTAHNSDTIYKLRASTGELIKKITIDGHGSAFHLFTIIGTPIADENLIYIASTNDSLYALDTGTYETKWRFGAPDFSPFYASPVIYKDNIYVATVGSGSGIASNGHVYCIDKKNGPDATTGLPIWDYPGAGVTSPASFVSSPCVSYPHLFIGSASDSNLYNINLDADPATPTVGVLRWTYKTGGNIYSSPTAYAGICLVGSNDFYLYCIDTQTAAFRWRFYTNGQVKSSPIISNQVVYVGSYDYNLYALNLINGKQKWKFATKGLVKSSPLPYNGMVYVASYDNYIYAVDSTFGTMKWSYYINGNIQSSPAIDDLGGRNQINSAISGFNTSGNNN